MDKGTDLGELLLSVLKLMLQCRLFRRRYRHLLLQLGQGGLELGDDLFLSVELSLQTPFSLLSLLQQLVLSIQSPLRRLVFGIQTILGPHGSEVLVVCFGFLHGISTGCVMDSRLHH